MSVTENKSYPPSCDPLNVKQANQNSEEPYKNCAVETNNITPRKSTSLPPSCFGEDSHKYNKDSED